jgi:hypothetical protein
LLIKKTSAPDALFSMILLKIRSYEMLTENEDEESMV